MSPMLRRMRGAALLREPRNIVPIRWKALQDWFKEARMVNLKIKEQTFSKKQK